MSSSSNQIGRIKVAVEITVRASSVGEATLTISNKLNSYNPTLHPDEPIETFTFGGARVAASPWRLRSQTAPPKAFPFLAIDANIIEAPELVRALHWNNEVREFLDYEGEAFPFTHWMPIPDL